MSNYYETLGVNKEASADDIKKSYRKLSMKYHPDHNQGNDAAEAKFKEINEAYTILSNPEKRQEYDSPDPLKGMFGGFSGGFGFQRPRPRKPDLNAPRDGKVIILEAELPLRLFLFGGKFKATASYHEGCTDCGGKGFTDSTECDLCHGEGYMDQVDRRPGFVSHSTRPCPKCGGLGQMATKTCGTCSGRGNRFVENKETFFDIPSNVQLGSRFVAPSQGRTGLNGGRTGDVGLIIVGIKQPDINKLTAEQIEQLENLLGELDNDNASA